MQQDRNWYAIRIFYNRINSFIQALEKGGVETYAPQINGKPLIPSVIFVRCSLDFIMNLRRDHFDQLMVYCNRSSNDDGSHTRTPAPIRDEDMQAFRRLASSGLEGLEYLGEDNPAWFEGQKVRVVEGPWKGYEGVIKRIKKDRRLLIRIENVAVLATGYIPVTQLEPITT